MRHRSKLLACAFLSLLLTAISCQSESFDVDGETIAVYRNRLAQLPSLQPEPKLIRPNANGSTSKPGVTPLESVLGQRQASSVVQLGLQDALHRALANNWDIKVQGYAPGISAADIVIADAAFDAVLFADYKYANLDEPSNSTAFPTGPSVTHYGDVGVKKLLDSGAQVQAVYNLDRQVAQMPFQRFNPHWDINTTVQITQPLLQGFGVDVNRAQTYINRNKRDVSIFEFRRQVIETLGKVEQAYWNLHQARQALAIQRLLLAQTEKTLGLVTQRLLYDALPVNVIQVKSAVATRRAGIVRLIGNVKDAEDVLKGLMNDPALPQEQDIAIVPTDEPITMQIPVDPQKELWAGLENRGELQEARLNIASASITRGVARNQLLPQLSAFAQWKTLGLKDDFKDTTHQWIGTRFQDYTVGLSFQFPLGNRAANAQLRKSQLQLDQAVATYHGGAALIMTQIRTAVRDVQTSYDEIVANKEAVQAAADNLAALIARREKLSPDYLDLELRAQETLADTRQALQTAIARYNNAIVTLEQAKGTVLRYDRIELAPESP